LALKPSFVYAFINTKDTHILREFYTIQFAKAFGYEINYALRYNLTKKSTLKISITYIDIEDKDTDMDYYNKFNKKYKSLQSSYNFRNTTVGIHYNYSF
jgi:opacity protein-like surface antigen